MRKRRHVQPLVPARTAHPRHREHGQTLVFFVILLPVVVLCTLWVYNATQAIAEKRRLQNTLDAMTWSASTVMARNLNYLAYTNRAMAANEAGIATIASMQTTGSAVVSTMSNTFEMVALSYGLQEIANLQSAADWSWLPPASAGYLTEALGNLVDAHAWGRRANTASDIEPLVALPFQAFADVLRTLNYGIATSQNAMYAATVAALPDTIETVRKANDPATEYPSVDTLANVLAFGTRFGTYIRPYAQSLPLPGASAAQRFDEALRFAHAAKSSRDDFTKERRILPTALFKGIPGAGVVSDLVSVLIDWRGGTELVSEAADGSTTGRLRWQSADTLSTSLPINKVPFGDFPAPWTFNAVDWKAYLSQQRFSLGAGAAGQSSAATNPDASWQGQGVGMTGEKQPKKKYGGINDDDGSVNDAGFWRATRDSGSDRNLFNGLTAAAVVPLRFDSRWRYGPRQRIGMLTSDWYMAPFYDVRLHPRLVEYQSDDWLGQQAVNGANPLNWGAETDRGPSLTLTLRKQARSVPSADAKGFGHAAGTIGMDDLFDRAALEVLSSAQVYFRRPLDRWARKPAKDDPPDFVGSAGYVEHRSLFSPYWHAHNVQASLWARALARGTALVGAAAHPDN